MTSNVATPPAANVSGPIMPRLKEATDELHRHAEGRKMQQDLMKGALAQTRFAAYLGQLRHVHAAMETRLERDATASPGDANVRAIWRAEPAHDLAHTAAIDADIETLAPDAGPTPALPATASLIADFETVADTTPAALLGALYVLEGSMNGNKFIARAVRGAYRLEGRAGTAYLDPYGEAQPERWQAFRTGMDALTLDEPTATALIETAQRTFRGIAEISDAVVVD